jgi:hypothetical protein
MPIATINGVTAGNISLLNGISYTLVSTYNGVVSSSAPAPPPATSSFVTSSLLAYWDPNDSGSRGLYPFEAGISCSFNLAHNYTSSVHTQNGSGSLYLGGTIFRNFTSGSVNITTYYFDGVNDFAALRPIANPAWTGDPNVVNTLTTLSYEIWLRSSGSWISSGNWISAAGNQGVRVRANDTSGQIWVYVPNVATAVTPGGTVSTNVWNHLVITLQNVNATNDRLTGYVNGTQVFQDTTGNYVPNYALAEFMLGTFFFSSEFQRMYVGEVRRYNKELTSAEVLTNFSSSAARYGRL